MGHKNIILKIFTIAIFIIFTSCGENRNSNSEMINLLSTVAKSEYTPENSFCPEAQLTSYDSVLKFSGDYVQIATAWQYKANTSLKLGDEQQAVSLLETLQKKG